MTRQLRDVLGKLYKWPANGTRQVFALSRRDAEKLPRSPSIAIISVTAPERPPASLDGFAHLLRLSFADVDFLSPNLSKKSRGKLVHAFTAEQAQAIHSFIEALSTEVVSVVVHCEGGYSRLRHRPSAPPTIRLPSGNRASFASQPINRSHDAGK